MKTEPIVQKHLFTSLSEEEVLSAVTLFREPLYKYAGGTVPDMHVLFCGTGSYVDAMLQTVLVVGQMLNRPLHVHVLASDALEYRDRLLERAPMLAKFSDIGGRKPAEETLVHFDFQKITRFDGKDNRAMLSRMLGNCRYIVVDLRHKVTLMKTIAALCGASDEPRLVCHTGEPEIEPVGKLRLHRIDQWDKAGRECSLRLSWRAFRLGYFYDRRYSSAGMQMADSLAAFCKEGNVYNQRANLLAVLHTGYKLASIGVNAAGRRASITAACARVLYGEDRTKYDDLTALEHRRWMMEKILAGYQSPTMDEMLTYCFNGEKLADKWWNENRMFHNCLCSSRPRSESTLHKLTPAEWNRYGGQELTSAEALQRIRESGFDPLDQMSLLVHYLAGQKMKEMEPEIHRGLARLTEDVDRRFSSIGTPEDLPPRQDDKILRWFEQLQRGGELHKVEEMHLLLNKFVQEIDLPMEPVETLWKNITRYIRLAHEFFSLKDYKSMDEVVVDLPLIMYTLPTPITLVKVGAAGILENVASSLLIEPQKLILTDLSEAEVRNAAAFFAGRGDFLDVVSKRIGAAGDSQRLNRLKRLIRGCCSEGFCVVDVTGADGVEMLDIVTFIREEKLEAAVITCDSAAQRIRNLYNFPEADCIRGQISLRVGEVFELLGASQVHDRNDEYDALEVLSRWKDLWGFYQDNRASMTSVQNLISAMVNAQNSDVGFCTEAKEEWFEKFDFSRKSQAVFDALQIRQLLTSLQRYGYVRKLKIASPVRGKVDFSGEMTRPMLNNLHMRSLLNMDENAVALRAFQRPDCSVSLNFLNKEEEALHVNVEFAPGSYKRITLIQNAKTEENPNLVHPSLLRMLETRKNNGSISEYGVTTNVKPNNSSTETICSFVEPDANLLCLSYRDKDGKPRVYSYPGAEITKFLNGMSRAKLIYALHKSTYPKRKLGVDVTRFDFRFTSAADRNHLTSIGSFLESRVFAEATELGLFDDVRTNYKFRWDQSNGALNEFDVLLTRGLQVFIVSCKAADSTKEHLYEVSALAKRFAKTAVPIIVYADKSRVKVSERQRAKDLGVMVAYAECSNTKLDGTSNNKDEKVEANETISAVLTMAVQEN